MLYASCRTKKRFFLQNSFHDIGNMACKSQNSSVKVISCRDFKILLRKLSDKNNRSIVHTIEGKQQNKINLDIKAKMQHIHLKEGRCVK